MRSTALRSWGFSGMQESSAKLEWRPEGHVALGGKRAGHLPSESAQPELEPAEPGSCPCPSHRTVIPRVQQPCFVEQVIYRVAQDPHSLNVVHELVFQTFRNEL